jgi:hypothetical protein
MKKRSSGLSLRAIAVRLLFVLSVLLITGTGLVRAQGYIRAARGFSQTGTNNLDGLVADNSGNSYLLRRATSNTFPVTMPPAATGGGSKSILIKLDLDGNILWSRHLPMSASGTGNTVYSDIILDNGVLHLIGTTTATDVPTTNGSTAGGGGSDILYLRIDPATGGTLFTGYYGGNGADASGLGIAVANGAAYITYTTTSSDIPVTTGPSFTSGYDHVIQKLDGSGNIVYSRYTGRVSTTGTNTDVVSLKEESGLVYLGLVVNATGAFATTNGTTVQGGADLGIIKLDASGNTTFASVIGGTGDEINPAIDVKNGEMYLAGQSSSVNYPVTDGSSLGYNGSALYPNSYVITKYGSTGGYMFSRYAVGLTAESEVPRIKWYNGAVYLSGDMYGADAGITPTTPSTGSTYLVKLNASSGQQEFANRCGGLWSSLNNLSGTNLVIDNGRIFVYSTTGNRSAVTTDGSPKPGTSGIHLAVFDEQGTLQYATLKLAGAASTAAWSLRLAVVGSHVLFSGNATNINNYPATFPVLGSAAPGVQIVWASLELCPPMPTDNTITPLTQTICTNGFTTSLTGNKVAYASSNMPVVYRGAVVVEQSEIPARYQWQTATAAGGPWTNIAGVGTQKDYSPPSTSITRYYRRIVYPPLGCGDTPVSTSTVAEVVVGANVAPAVTADIFNTCAGTPIDIVASVSGGATPYAFSWDNGISSTTANATVTPAGNSVYTLTVTDNNGCKQAGQVLVNAYAADAGPASVSSCAGAPVRIGTAPPAGLTGVTYAWSPVDGLSDPNIAQPLASPAVTTVYTLTVTVPLAAGGTCSTTDQVTVDVVTAPAEPNFAGDDKAVCLGGALSLGTAAESGFTYIWAPGNYLSDVTASITTFNSGSTQPHPNSFTYTLSATKNGCVFNDAVTVSVLEVDAGLALCGPRTVGKGDLIPGVAGKTYLWEKVSGPGSITGATHTAQTTVSESIGGTTIYRLTVSLLGVSCSDLVEVPDCGAVSGCPNVEIDVDSKYGCPSNAFGTVRLVARPFNVASDEWTYTWSSSPSGGISGTTGSSITLTDNVERDITLTITSVYNPSVTCFKTIHVNAPAWSLPVFSATDATICPGGSAQIGNTAIPGYDYLWKTLTLPDQTSSNPTVSPDKSTNYEVTITDNASGCLIKDTATVIVQDVVSNAGADWTVCSNAVIQLGAPAVPGFSYSWVPSVAGYQDGTTASSADPKVLVTIPQDFTLTTTDLGTGCSKDSTIHVVVDAGNALPAMNNPTICKGDNVTIGLPEWKNVTYNWSPATGLSSTTVAQPVATPASTQTYTLTVTYYDEFGSPICTKTGDVTVTVNEPLITMSDETICPSGTLYNPGSGVSVTGATLYSWSPAALVTNPSALNTTVKANPNVPTTFTLQATDAQGCSSSMSKVISPVNAPPIAGSNTMICVGGNMDLGDASNTGTITWSVTPALEVPITDVNAATFVYTPTAGDAGKTFTFTISQNIGGCTNTAKATVIVKALTLPAITPQTVCSGASATIGVTAQNNTSYYWTPETGLSDPYAATTQVTSVTGNTSYTLTAIDNNGCFATTDAIVGVNPTPAPSVSVPDVVVGLGGTPPPFNPQITPAGPSYTYTWTPETKVDNPYIANARAIASGVGNSTYTLTVTDENGCTSTAQAQLTVKQLIALPITLAYFEASQKDCGVYLRWKVESAENFSRFIVERSKDGVSFADLASINYEAYRQNYYFDDTDPGNAKWYYRLKMVDIDGSVKFSRVATATVNCASNNRLVVYPNPIGSVVNIRSSKAVKKVVLLSMMGNVVKQQSHNQSQPGSLQVIMDTQLAAGTYILEIWNSDGSVQHVKLLKR